MKITWIFPRNKACGISFYSQKYVQALRRSVAIECLDPLDFRNNRKEFLKIVQSCQVCHIQYETSFFLLKNKDFYPDFCSAIKCPIIVTLHEVYKQFPDVFPRDEIQGNIFTKPIKKYIYDRRHPHATAFGRHGAKGFYADKIIVHARFQKDILIEKGLRPDAIEVLPVPIKSINKTFRNEWEKGRALNLAATGFINPSYDYELLFKALDLCKIPWKFTWIGGVRRAEDQALLDTIKADIAKRGWEKRFVVTGSISDERRDALLSNIQVYCAIFKHKSSSESLATAIGARTLIVATRLQLTEEMASEFPVMHIVDNDPAKIAAAIKKISSNARVRGSLTNACEKYSRKYSYANMAEQMATTYEDLQTV